MWSRIHLIPVLQAEEDRDLVRRHLADKAREKELLGENIRVYNSDRYDLFPSSFFGLSVFSTRHLVLELLCPWLSLGLVVVMNIFE